MRIVLYLIVVGFLAFCGWLVVQTGFFNGSQAAGESRCILLQQTTAKTADIVKVPAGGGARLEAADFTTFRADNAPARNVTLGSLDPESGFKYQLELSSKGGAIEKAALSEFDDRDYKDPQPLVILSPVSRADGSKILSMANADFVFVQQQLKLALDKLHWKSFYIETGYDGSQTARFEALIKDGAGKPALKLDKTYRVMPNSYHLDCDVTVENLMASELKVRFNLVGPAGIGREAARADMRKVVGGFRDLQGQISSVRLDIKKLSKAKGLDDRRLMKAGTGFLWAAAVNKYFAAILVPVADNGEVFCEWVADKTGWFYDPDGLAESGDETVGLDLKIASSTLASVGQIDSVKTYNFQLYLGPKDKSLFDRNELYQKLGFVQAIDFMPCFCCPATIINPLAFGVLAVMRWMYGFIGNYGVVIIILVFMVRLVMHPVTKKSQVSMSKFSKLAPKAEEIKKRHAGNKAEINKQIMALYKEQGASPIMGFLPMMVQMPIWIALYSAIYASIELRGAPFLPFWITDLSVPDALVRFSTLTVPLLGWKVDSLNLLPILMGVAFYLQQKLMPSQAAASANPQVAQQQKMMMIMMPLMFPLLLYKAPSGLNLYIMASTFAGIIEQHVIRKHIREKEGQESAGLVAVTSKTGGKVKKKKPKPFFRT